MPVRVVPVHLRTLHVAIKDVETLHPSKVQHVHNHARMWPKNPIFYYMTLIVADLIHAQSQVTVDEILRLLAHPDNKVLYT